MNLARHNQIAWDVILGSEVVRTYKPAPSMTLVTRVIGRSKRQNETWWFYLDDGVYGAQSGRIFDYINYPMTVFTEGCESTPAVFAGPTCDSVDRFGDHENLPKLSLGDVIVIPKVGAYSIATACHFNGIAPRSIIDLEDTSETQRSQA